MIVEPIFTLLLMLPVIRRFSKGHPHNEPIRRAPWISPRSRILGKLLEVASAAKASKLGLRDATYLVVSFQNQTWPCCVLHQPSRHVVMMPLPCDNQRLMLPRINAIGCARYAFQLDCS